MGSLSILSGGTLILLLLRRGEQVPLWTMSIRRSVGCQAYTLILLRCGAGSALDFVHLAVRRVPGVYPDPAPA
jgi:hypothetical protein